MGTGQNENMSAHSNAHPDQSRGFVAPPAEEPFIPGTTLKDRSTFMLRAPLDARYAPYMPCFVLPQRLVSTTCQGTPCSTGAMAGSGPARI